MLTTMDEATEQLKILLLRETRYNREDYLGSAAKEEGSTTTRMMLTKSIASAGEKSSAESAENSLLSKDTTTTSTTTSSNNKTKKLMFTEHHRTRLCEWAVEVVKYYNFPLYSVEVAMNILDRYLAKFVPPHERSMDTLHLLTLTSLYLALKLTTLQRPAPEIFVRLSRSKFTARQVEATELQMMQGLDWLLHPPTTEEFAQYYLAILSTVYPGDILERMEEYTLESIRGTVSDYVWVRFAPSAVAMGAVCWSLHQMGLGAADCYPSPLAELHRCDIMVHQLESMQALEYFYLRAMYSVAQEQGEAHVVQPSSLVSRKRPAPGDGPRTSPVSFKDHPNVIED
mmetsp:Transcript_24511/g.57489  ORF Transcript_24511/g.57489 Transcript_24511/m.57489 type:complete len:342 (+) Transcript_24511:74-1099(+)